MVCTSLCFPLLDWYADHARDLPWRAPDAGAWAVLVSEVMLQQTPVRRVLPVYETWLERWPTPTSLAASSPGEAVRTWGRLGYPRRALRLHQAATEIVARHDGVVPAEVSDLRELPGVGSYTAAAVSSFAYGQRHAVLDTNVRRVLSRVVNGRAAPTASPTVAERRQADELLPDDGISAAAWSVAVMELGALVCAAAAPRCGACPLAHACRWRLAGYPGRESRPVRRQPYDGTDRQCRGRLLAVLRDAKGPVRRPQLEAAWHEAAQRERALDGLVADGLAEPVGKDSFRLPTGSGLTPR